MVYAGWSKYLHIAAESAWGTLDGTPAYRQIPVQSETLKSTPIQVTADSFCGLRQNTFARVAGYDVAGNITAFLYGWQDASNVSLAQHLVAWAFTGGSSLDLSSKSIERFDSDVDNKRWLGNRVNQAVISGTAGGPISISLDVIGQSETGGITEQTWAADDGYAIEQSVFVMEDMTFEIPSATAVLIESFQLTIQNNLQPKRLSGSPTIAHLSAGLRVCSLQFSIPKAANTYDALRRTTGETVTTGQINLKGLHKGTGTTGSYTTLVIDIGKQAMSDATVVDGDRNALVMVGPQYLAINPANGDDEVKLTWGEAA